MNRRIITSVVVLTTIALFGLIVLQLYLIGHALKVREATFVNAVDRSVEHVLQALNQNEIRKQYERQVQYIQIQSNIKHTYDSIMKAFNNTFPFPLSGDNYLQYLERASETRNLIQEMILSYRQNLNENLSIDPLYIDSLIAVELKQHGVNTKYEMGIFSPLTNSMLFQKTGYYPQELLNEAFIYDMFPVLATPHHAEKLLLYFPNEKRFVLKQIWDILGISGFLIAIIVLCFATTIFTIIRQKKLSEMKNDLINNMTHEFKTPISTISLACQALADKDIQKTEGLYETYISMIAEENRRLGTMAEQILLSAVMEKGEMIFNKEVVDIDQIIQECYVAEKLAVTQKGGTIRCDLNAKQTLIYGDKMHLKNVILNLLDNAIKYANGTPKIAIQTRNIPHAIEVSVQDNGPGISKANQKRIFEKLYRVPTGNIHNVKGFGLGLNYVKNIVEEHGGFVHLNSESKNGSTFFIRLPLYEV
ncbi:MAG: HAMP domain-containing histidine kinase [Lentimicrobiaceae bacterium]|jgi:two-component system phosphate regulon sensor histidine kinase PhoR|nr:HAMP domain-containing histidine kinase [Lentimicrobiaceae bacterium]